MYFDIFFVIIFISLSLSNQQFSAELTCFILTGFCSNPSSSSPIARHFTITYRRIKACKRPRVSCNIVAIRRIRTYNIQINPERI